MKVIRSMKSMLILLTARQLLSSKLKDFGEMRVGAILIKQNTTNMQQNSPILCVNN